MENKATEAAFSLENFKFTFVNLDFASAPDEDDLGIDFKPSGIYYKDKHLYELKIEFIAFANLKGDKSPPPFINVTVIADFDLKNTESKEDIPSFFYKNSIAIVYPYIRSFVSSLSLQANSGTLILPTLNLTMLEDTLIENTTEN